MAGITHQQAIDRLQLELESKLLELQYNRHLTQQKLDSLVQVIELMKATAENKD